MPIIPGIVASEASAHLQPQPPFIDTISGAVVISGGTTSGSNSIVQVYLTPNPLGHPLTSYGVTAFSGTPLVAVSGATVTGTTSPLTITYPFAANGLYQFAGYARNNYGNSNYGNQSNQVEPFLATATPSGLAVSGTSVSSVQFTFLQIPGSTNYILSAAGSFTDNAGLTTVDNFAVNVAGPGTSPTVTGVMNHGFFTGMPYKFYVQSQNFAGTSASGANIILTPNPFAAPTVTPIFTAIPSGNNSIINVTVTNPDTNPLHNLPNGYYYVDTNNGFSSTKILANTVTLSGLTNPIEPVAIVNVTAIGPYGTNPGTPQTLLFPPATPASIVATVTTSGSGFNAQSATATINVTWSQTSNQQYSAPTNYIITASAAGYPSVSTSSSTTSANLTGSFNVNTNYTVTVTATNGGGSATGSAGSTVQPYTVVVPGAVTSVTATATSTTTVNLSWSAPSSGGPYSNFTIYDNNFLTSNTFPSGTTSGTITANFVLGASYTFYAYASNAAGAGTAGSSNSVLPNPKPTVTATNATHYSDSTYDYAVWRTTGTLLITNSILTSVEILAVGAGGGGGAYKNVTGGATGGGGGGAGQIIAQSYGTLGTAAINVNIGAGGAGGSSANGAIGGSSILIYNSPPYAQLFYVYGGGGGGYNGAGVNGANGGGGSANNGAGGTGLNPSTGQLNGYKGGTGYVQTAGSAEFAGGGGGAFQDGQGGVTNSNGGAGLQFSDWSSATSTGDSGYYAGGGGGGESNDDLDSWGKGGAGGGGVGASLNANPRQATAGTANTGGGGGGAAGPSYSTAGAGGSGLIILRWPLGTAIIGF
jgi:hypothetical protein